MSTSRFLSKLKWLIVLLAVIGLGAWWYISRNNKPPAATITVKRGTIVQEVSVTGKTKPVKAADLGFDRSGKVVSVAVEVGDRVNAGDPLVSLDASDLTAQLASARANVDAQKARLEELEAGARPEDIQIAKTDVAKAESDLNNAYSNVPNTISDAYNKADDAVRKQLDAMFTNDEYQPTLVFQTSLSQSKLDAENYRAAATASLNAWKAEIASFQGLQPGVASQPTWDTALSQAIQHLNDVSRLLTKVMDAVVDNIALAAATADSYRAAITLARTNVNTAINTVSSLQQSINTQKVLLQRAKDALALKQAGATPESIAAAQAAVRQAQATAESIVSQINKMTLRSPISGLVTRQDAKRGQVVGVNSVLVSVISDANMEIEANVPEVDIGKVALGNPVDIVLDAFPNETLTGKVASIDPAETIVDGVVNYKVKVAFDKADARIKSGLTANLSIRTLEKNNVLLIPSYAITEKNGKTYVLIPEDKNKNKEVEITLGIRGKDGNVEVLSGVQEGQRVINIGLKTK